MGSAPGDRSGAPGLPAPKCLSPNAESAVRAFKLRPGRPFRYPEQVMHLGLRIAVVLLVIAPMAPSLATDAAAGNTYSRIDHEGVTHLTDAPTDPRFRRVPGLSGTAKGWLAVPQAARGTRWGQEIQEISGRYGVDPALVHAVIGAESAFNPWAISRKGAQGLMQLMPRTASALGVRDSFNPRDNIEGGVRHLGY